MTASVELSELYAAIETSAGLLGIVPSRDKVWPILTTYAEVLPEAVIAFRVATDARHDREFDCRFTVPRDVDPYVLALAAGLTPKTEHPIGRLLGEIQERFRIDSYGVDFGVVGGFTKNWVYFPEDGFPTLAEVAALPSMPPSLAGNADFFVRHGMQDRVEIIAIEHARKTVNVYFPKPPDEPLDATTVRTMHRELGLPEPSDRMLEFCAGAFGVYTTLSWDSPLIERISFGVTTPDPLTLSTRLGPKIERFLTTVPYGVDDPKKVFVAMTSSGEEYYKLQSYYRLLPRKLSVRRQTP